MTEELDGPLETVNIVVAGELGTGELDVETLAADMDASEVNTMPGRAYITPTESSPVLMLYRSGKYVIAGAKNEDDILAIIEWLTDELRRLSVEADSNIIQSSKEIRYRVVSANLQQNLDLSHLVIVLGLENIEYEPEQFPALIYRDETQGCTHLIFSTGKVLITGVKDLSEAEDAYHRLTDAISSVLSE
jgi:transcription initiation factor TFIID TATA-box-binding protein